MEEIIDKLKELEKKAKAGDIQAMFELGAEYAEKALKLKDEKEAQPLWNKARKLWEKAAAKGHADTMFYLGLMYYRGDGVSVDKGRARELWEQAAAKGHADAMLYLGLMYFWGDGVSEDKVRARELWEQAAARGHAEAMFNLGLMYYTGDGVSVDKGRARELWEQAAAKGQPEAMFRLGLMYYRGDGVSEDKVRARKLWEQAAADGHADAMFNLGLMYDKGDGVSVDKGRVRKLWEQAAAKGQPEAMLNLGFMYYWGDGVSADKGKARELWEQAAAKGHADSMFNLGLMYDKGDSVSADKGKARELWEQAAAKGHADAMFNLGLMYDTGDGVSADKDKARELWEQAVAKGNADAMFNLGIMYYRGDGVSEDKGKARELWEQAAEKGHAGAMFSLGVMYFIGKGVSADKGKARKFWEQAAAEGHADAMVKLGLMYYRGDGVSADKGRARELWKQAAAKGHAKAMFNLGNMYYRGDSVSADKRRARKFWEGAAKRGHALALLFIKLMEICKNEPPEGLLDSFLALYVNVTNWKISLHFREGKVVHYTSVEALASIIRSRRFRLYNICYANDPSEGTALVELSKKENFNLHEFFPEDEAETIPAAYVASFCTGEKDQKAETKETREPELEKSDEIEDQLVFWRAYGRDGKGVSLVIPAEVFNDTPEEIPAVIAGKLMELASKSISDSEGLKGQEEPAGEAEKVEEREEEGRPRLCLFKVVYDEKTMKKILEALKDPLKKIKKLVDDRNYKREVYELVRMVLGDVLYLCKHKSYVQENEVRMISIHFPGDERIKLDERGGRLFVETREFLFSHGDYKVVIGPSVDSPVSVRLLLEHKWHSEKCRERLEVKVSRIPYRGR